MARKLQVLGAGCMKCAQLAERVEAAAEALGIDYELVKVTDMLEITRYGVMLTPALCVDGEVKVVGKVPTVDALKQIIA